MTPLVLPPIEKKALRPYQVEDLTFLVLNKRAINRSEPATGKTGSACMLAYYVWMEENGCTIMLQPKSLLYKNYLEMLCFTDFAPEELFIFDPVKARKLTRAPKVVLTTADTLGRHWETIRQLTETPPALLIADECHLYYSTDASKRTQKFYEIMRHIPRFLGMTGTAVRGRMDSAYPLIQVIEPRYYGSHARFMAQHALTDAYGKVLGWTNHLKLGKILLHHGINRTFAECYGKEKKMIIPVPLELSGGHRRIYDTFHEMAMAELSDDRVLTATTEGVHTIRCRQILSHPETFEFQEWQKEGTLPKDQWVLEEICEQYNCALLFCVLKPEQERLTKLLQDKGYKVALINGDTSLARRRYIDAEFQAGRLDFIVASPATAGVGFNWQRAEAVVFVSSDYMDDNVVQAYRRAIRGIRETVLPIYVLQYVDTIEQKVLKIVERKSDLAAKVDPSREALTGLAIWK